MKHDFKLGDVVECVNSEGWEDFVKGGVYKVTSVWKPHPFFGPHSPGFDLDGCHVACDFADDFKLVRRA